MARDLTPTELDEMLGAYVLGAVEPDERVQIERHVRASSDAANEVALMEEAAVWLAVSGAPASQSLWERISDAVDERERAAAGRRLDASAPAELASRRRANRRVPRSRLLVAALVVVGLAVSAAAILPGVLSGPQGRSVDLSAAATRAAALPDSRTVALRSEDGALQASVVVRPDGSGFLRPEALPSLPTGRAYQLWAVDDTDTISVGVLGHEPHVVAFNASGAPSAFAITVERAGGVVRSSQQPVAAGRVTPA